MKLFSLHRRCLPLALLAAAVPAFAQQGGGMERGAGAPPPRDVMPRVPMQTAQMDGGRSLSDAVRRVQRSTGGQILGAEQIPFDGRSINRVKYMDDHGRVRYMDDPAPARVQPRAESRPLPPPRGDNP